MRVISVCLSSILLILLLNLNLASAHNDYQLPEVSEGQINEALQKTVPLRFLPSHPLYFLISIKEVFTRIFQPSAVQKSQFDLVLSGKRLKETYLLLNENKIEAASKNLIRYEKKSSKMINQLEKARSQNQDIADLVGEIADTFKIHEILLYAINTKWQMLEDSHGFDENFSRAVDGFTNVVIAIDNIEPGLKDRFKTVTRTEESRDKLPTPLPLATASPLFIEASPSVKPRRIIY